jgi:hypothetical protein
MSSLWRTLSLDWLDGAAARGTHQPRPTRAFGPADRWKAATIVGLRVALVVGGFWVALKVVARSAGG